MPSIAKLHWAYVSVIMATAILLFFAYKYNSMAGESIDSATGAWRAYGAASVAFTFAGMLGGIVAGALRMIVRHIEALENALAAFVESDADPKESKQALADFLRESRKIKTQEIESPRES